MAAAGSASGSAGAGVALSAMHKKKRGTVCVEGIGGPD